MSNPQAFQPLRDQLDFLEASYHLHICVKDYVGFIPINKELSGILAPYLGHNNPYCMFIKQDRERYHHCLSMMKKMANRCIAESQPFCGTCYAGVGEYIAPILWEGRLLGAITAGFFPVSDQERDSRILRAMEGCGEAERQTARALYDEHIQPTAVAPQTVLPTLNLMASYLAMTYRMGQESVTGQQLIRSRKNSSADDIFSHALAFIHQEYCSRITVGLLAAECHCSESHLNHMLKKRLGMGFSTYLNKLRIERAKEYLLETGDSILSIALRTGFQDANYFARTFKQLMGIQPSEFRRRYQ